MQVIDCSQLKNFISRFGLVTFMSKLVARLEKDFLRWEDFDKSPRHAVHVNHGVMELMPCSDGKYYTFKYVNGHPGNTFIGKLNIVGFGVLAEVKTGMPLLMSEMTWLTAIRTACMSSLVAKYGAAKSAKSVGIIGCGSQSEFQIIAMHSIMNINDIYYYDKDPAAMKKFANNLSSNKLNLHACAAPAEVASYSDILVTNIGFKGRESLLDVKDLRPGHLIIAIGGDCPGKTELSKSVLESADQIWVEYLPQTKIEGEIQQLDHVDAHEIKDIVSGKFGRNNEKEIIIFDGVGFALEDFSVLSLLHEYTKADVSIPTQYIAPKLENPKNLFGALYD